MKQSGPCMVVLALLYGTICHAQTSVVSSADKVSDSEKLTVITSTRLTFDYKNHYALFEENVVVVDPEMKILADRMNVSFGEDNQVSSIQADGKVHILQEDKKARSDKAEYEVATGKIVLRGNPQVTRGKDILTGDTITFWRNENKMVCEPRARLVIYPDGERGSLMPMGGK